VVHSDRPDHTYLKSHTGLVVPTASFLGSATLRTRKKKTIRFGLASDRFESTETETDIGSVGTTEDTTEVLPEVQIYRRPLIPGSGFVYYESIKRELKIRPIYECRCDERLKTKVKEFTRLP
jgi:hypothetical protein